MERERIFEHEGHWLVRRPDTERYYIAWWPGGPGVRRIRRLATGTADLASAKQRLISHVEHRRANALPPNTIKASAASNGTPIAQPFALPSDTPTVRPTDPVLVDLLCDYVERLRNRPSYRVAVPALALWTTFCRQTNLVYISEFNLDAQERFVQWRRNTIKCRSNSGPNGSINRDLSVLKAALRDGWKRGKLAVVPYVMSLPAPPPRDRFLTVEEAKQLLAECREPHLRRYVLLALHTLQRPSAILGLRASQVDLVRGRIDFLAPGSAQTKKRRPVVPITDTLRPELEQAIEDSMSGFIVEWMGRPVRGIRTAFSKACKRAGLEGVSPYTLRHTGATLLAATGVSMRQIAGMLGHSDGRVTELYAKHRPEFLLEASKALDGLFGVA